MKNLRFEAVCRYFGSQQKTANLLGVTLGAVSQVVHGRRPLPIKWCPIIERSSNRRFKCEELRPDCEWSVLRQPSTEAKEECK